MKKIDFGQAVGILGNIAVVIGILLLVYELNQNRQMMQAQTRSNIAHGITDFLVTIGSDERLSTLWSLGAAGEPLDEAQSRQFELLMAGFLRYLEDVHYQNRNDLYAQDEFSTQMEQIRRVFAAPGTRRYWCERPIVLSREFTSEIDRFVTCP